MTSRAVLFYTGMSCVVLTAHLVHNNTLLHPRNSVLRNHIALLETAHQQQLQAVRGESQRTLQERLQQLIRLHLPRRYCKLSSGGTVCIRSFRTALVDSKWEFLKSRDKVYKRRPREVFHAPSAASAGNHLVAALLAISNTSLGGLTRRISALCFSFNSSRFSLTIRITGTITDSLGHRFLLLAHGQAISGPRRALHCR